MSLGRTFTVDSGAQVLGSVTTQQVFLGITTGTIPAYIEAIRISVLGATTFPANASITCVLARASAGYAAGGTTVTANPHLSGDVAALTTFKNASTTLTTYTIGAFLWSQNIPLTAGSNWAEWVTPGAEWIIPGGTAFAAVYVTASSAPTSVSMQTELVFSE
jgi:hypothetical protein